MLFQPMFVLIRAGRKAVSEIAERDGLVIADAYPQQGD
jgi:hypothetical protein